MREEEDPIVVEQTYDATIGAVWDAITKVEQMVQWYFKEIPSFKPEVGFETRFEVQGEERNFPHVWKVTEVNPQRMIAYSWKYDGYPGDSVVRFELGGQDQLTKLTLTHRVQESFPEDIPEFARESGIAGWTYFIQSSLKKFLEKSPG